MMDRFSRDLVFTCLIGLLLWRVEAMSNSTWEDSAIAEAPKEAFTELPIKAPEAAPTTSPEEDPTTTPEAAPTPTPGEDPTPVIVQPTAPQRTVFDVTKYGAIGDGKTDNQKVQWL